LAEILIGYLDVVAYRTVSGWAYDPANPERKLAVNIFLNGGEAGSAVANIFRQDLLGFCGGRHGFSFAVPDHVNSIWDIEVRIAGSEQRLVRPALWLDEATNQPLPDGWKAGDGTHLYPSLFVLGAAKSGTTSLHNYLSQCVGVCVSNPKEPYYFEYELKRGSAFYYNRYFSHWNGERVVAEARHRNLYLPWVPRRIWEYKPLARLVVILREPVRRAISHWWHWRISSLEPLAFREAAIEDLRRIEIERKLPEETRICNYETALDDDRDGEYRTFREEAKLRTYIDSGYYLEQIDRFLQYFPRKQLHIMLVDDLIASPLEAMAGLLNFLEVDPALATRIQYPICNRSMEGQADHIEAETLAWLGAHYAPHNQRLAEFLGRPLPGWT